MMPFWVRDTLKVSLELVKIFLVVENYKLSGIPDRQRMYINSLKISSFWVSDIINRWMPCLIMALLERMCMKVFSSCTSLKHKSLLTNVENISSFLIKQMYEKS